MYEWYHGCIHRKSMHTHIAQHQHGYLRACSVPSPPSSCARRPPEAPVRGNADEEISKGTGSSGEVASRGNAAECRATKVLHVAMRHMTAVCAACGRESISERRDDAMRVLVCVCARARAFACVCIKGRPELSTGHEEDDRYVHMYSVHVRVCVYQSTGGEATCVTHEHPRD